MWPRKQGEATQDPVVGRSWGYDTRAGGERICAGCGPHVSPVGGAGLAGPNAVAVISYG